MRWSLRSQLIIIAVCTVTGVLLASQWLSMQTFSYELDRDLEDRARLLAKAVAELAETMDPITLHGYLTQMRRARRQVREIDLLEIGERVRWLVTTRTDVPPPESILEPEAAARLRAQEVVRSALPAEKDGTVPWRLAMPFADARGVLRVAQVEVLPWRLAHVRRHIYLEQAALMAISIVAIAFLLAWLVDRRVGRPVAALHQVMERARAGDLTVRTTGGGPAEVASLAVGLNEMLAQVESLTTGLRSKVEEATRDLAEKNRELRELNEQLDRARMEAAQRQPLAAAGQIASTVAHELGTPLNSILGYTQLLLRQNMPEDQRAKLSIVESQVHRVIETIQAILDRTRTHVGPREAVAMGPLVDEALAFVSQRVAEAKVHVKTEIPSDLPWFPADAVGIRQILVNLLTNAIDASEPDGTITVRAAVLPPVKDRPAQMEIAVSDTGRGLAAEELERIFEPFYTTKQPGAGTGLGLAIVSQIAADHGGRVFAESERGQGTTVRVQLPLEA